MNRLEENGNLESNTSEDDSKFEFKWLVARFLKAACIVEVNRRSQTRVFLSSFVI